MRLGILALIWGINFSVIKATLPSLSPFAFNALRFPVAVAVLTFFVLRLPASRPSRRDLVALVALGILGNVAYQILFILGLDATTAGNGSILLATAPVWTAILAGLAKQDRITGLLVGGITLTVLGISLVVWGGARNMLLISQDTLLGDSLILMSALVWAAYTVAGKGLVDRYGALRVTTWTLWAGTPGLILLGLPDLLALDWRAVPPAAWAGVLYAGCFGIGVAYLIWYAAVGVLGSSRTAIYSNTIPLVALAVAWVWLGEVPLPLQLVGCALVLLGVALARRGARRATSPRRLAGTSGAAPRETRTG